MTPRHINRTARRIVASVAAATALGASLMVSASVHSAGEGIWFNQPSHSTKAGEGIWFSKPSNSLKAGEGIWFSKGPKAPQHEGEGASRAAHASATPAEQERQAPQSGWPRRWAVGEEQPPRERQQLQGKYVGSESVSLQYRCLMLTSAKDQCGEDEVEHALHCSESLR